LRRLRASAVEERLGLDRIFAQSLRRYVAAQVKATRSRLTVLGSLSAFERLAAFLLEMSRRLATSTDVELPMDRTDIADYLGLTIETVSRSLTELRCQGAIMVKGGSIKINDRDALQLSVQSGLHRI
jgi:CRP-like cAMP-binding protein